MKYKIEYRRKYGHVEVYLNGVFLLSADTMAEAEAEVNAILMVA